MNDRLPRVRILASLLGLFLVLVAPADDEETEVTWDAMRDPVLTKFIRRRILIDKPRFSLETGGKIQMQYYDADLNSPDNEDQWLLRRVRPFLLGQFAKLQISHRGIPGRLGLRDEYFQETRIQVQYVW
jgi:hypothetical protein